MGSHPPGKSIWNGKSTAVSSASGSGFSEAITNYTLHQSLFFLNMPVLLQPEIYLGQTDKLFDEHGKVVGKSADFFRTVIDFYADWVKGILIK